MNHMKGRNSERRSDEKEDAESRRDHDRRTTS